ncbi:matrixin family metalloprotease [Candidatus Pacearchaeota archaeon]|nr:matrixin family metalloprotease [Candidatus Pacearchaeota archaeon]
MKKYAILLVILVTAFILTATLPIVAAPELEKVTFIHYKKDKVGNALGRPDFALKPPQCYKLMGVKWKSLPVNYQINPTNPQSLDSSFIVSAISAGATEWDTNTASNLFNSPDVNYSAYYGVQNFNNEISFGNYPIAGVIAVTTVWYTPINRQIVEFDIEFDTDFVWGDATVTNGTMDLQNIATHELGHSVGLADLYNTCTEETMYGYSDYNEIKKRTLNTGDLAGIKRLYG